MKHEPFIRDVPGSDTALLCIHGILGTPRHFEPLLPLVPPHWTVHNILLKGHGGSADNFAHATMADWRAQVHEEILRLSESHRRILIAAHSMGTLFAVQEAIDRKNVAGLFLLAVPVRIFPTPRAMATSLRVGLGHIHAGDARAEAARQACSITPDLRIWKYAKWIPNYLALFQESRHVRRMLPGLRTPCWVVQSTRDELTHPGASCFRGISSLQFILLPQAGHFFYPADDLATIQAAFTAFCRACG